MLVSPDWLKEHLSDPNLIILDTRPKTMFLYGHLPKSKLIPFTEGIGYTGSYFVTRNILKLFFHKIKFLKIKRLYAIVCMDIVHQVCFYN